MSLVILPKLSIEILRIFLYKDSFRNSYTDFPRYPFRDVFRSSYRVSLRISFQGLFLDFCRNCLQIFSQNPRDFCRKWIQWFFFLNSFHFETPGSILKIFERTFKEIPSENLSENFRGFFSRIFPCKDFPSNPTIFFLTILLIFSRFLWFL